jgi:hypothetical protein
MEGKMNVVKTMKLIFLTTCYFLVFSGLTIGELVAANYYISPDGADGKAGSIDSPWATFAHAQTQMSAGDTLILKDGTYHQSLTVSISGMTGKPVTFKAQNDGSAVVNGDYTRTPFEIDRKNYITVQGIYFKEGDDHVIDIDGSDHLIFQRVTASDCKNPENNYHVWRLEGVTNSLFEDCAGWGNGRNIMLVYKPSHHVTVRRFYGRYHDKQSTHGPVGIQVYGSNNCLLENVIITYDGKGTWGSSTEYYLSGINIWDNNQSSTYSNKIYGCVVYDLNMSQYPAQDTGVESKSFQSYGNKLLNNVSINNMHGFIFSNDRSLSAMNLTIVNSYSGVVFRDNYDNAAIDSLNLKNSIITGCANCGFRWWPGDTPSGNGSSISTTYNNWYNTKNFCNGKQDATEMNINPAFNTSTYGYGAYLMRPSVLAGLGDGGADLGAEVLYRYEDGQLTTTPLWPWPMENRIYSESGISVTYEANGGLWKALDNVYSETQTLSSPEGLKIINNN